MLHFDMRNTYMYVMKSANFVAEPEMDTAKHHILVKCVARERPELRVEDGMEESNYPTEDDDSRLVDVGYVYKQETGEEVVEMIEAGDLLQLQSDDGQLSGRMETEGEEEEEELFLVKAEPDSVKARQKEAVTYTPTQLVPPRAEIEPSQRKPIKVSPQPVKRFVQQE